MSEIIPEVNREIDAIGMNCPLPILYTKRALAEMASGQILMVKVTDAGAVHDFPVFAKQTGNELIATASKDDTLIFYLKRR